MTARIIDQGYRSYGGVRLGTAGAVRSLAKYSVLRALGLRRTFWAKVFPILSVVIAYLPAMVFVGVVALIPEQVRDDVDIIPEYHEYYGFISAAIVIFVALVGPEVLCPDRRNGTLGLYLASPLTRDTYLLAKVLAVVPVLMLVTVGPPLLLLLGRTFADAGPESVADFLAILARTIAGGVAVSAAYTAVSLAAASLTDRRAVASAGIILFLLVVNVAASVLVEDLDADARIYLLDVFFIPFELVQRIYGVVGVEPRISTAELVIANVLWTLAPLALMRERYRRLLVTR